MNHDSGVSLTRPFVKWAGGKARVMPQLTPLMPKKYNNYYEPFLGGGAFYFSLRSVKKAYLNDINAYLIEAYVHIRDNLDSLTKDLLTLENSYHALALVDQKQYYLDRREEYNSLEGNSLRKTSLLIFLNKTCFNGMYRENSKGGFNVPFGQHRAPTICDTKNLRNVSLRLASTELSTGSFIDVVKSAKKGDFIYLDPPYHPLNKTSSFTAYSREDFDETNQHELAGLYRQLDERGCYVMLSNSDTELIKELYSTYNINKILASRSINSKANGRGKINELVVTNYES